MLPKDISIIFIRIKDPTTLVVSPFSNLFQIFFKFESCNQARNKTEEYFSSTPVNQGSERIQPTSPQRKATRFQRIFSSSLSASKIPQHQSFLHFPIFFKFFSNSRVATRLEIKPRNTFHPHPLIKDRNEFSQRLHNEIPRTRITRTGESAVSLFRRSLAPSSPSWIIDRRTTTKPGLLSRDFRGPRLKQKRAARSLEAKIPGRVLRDRRDRGLPFTLSCPPLRREKRQKRRISRGEIEFSQIRRVARYGGKQKNSWRTVVAVVRRLQFSSSFFAYE